MNSTFNILLFASLLISLSPKNNCLSEVTPSTANYVVLSEIGPNARTYYDLQSNGSTFMLEQDQSNPNNLHACFVVSTDGGPGWVDRKVRYFHSTDRGATWMYLGPVTNTRSGFPSLVYKNDGSAIIMATSSDINDSLRALFYVDVAPGAATWTIFDPGLAGNVQSGNHNIAIDRRNNNISFTVSSFKNQAIDITAPPGVFIGYTPVDATSQPSVCAVGVSGTGKISIAYITSAQTSVPPGSVRLIESTDDGNTWSSPVNIWVANYQTDSLAALRGLDCSYLNDNPNVVFEVCKRTQDAAFFPKLLSKIMFWSPLINSGIPVKIDSASGLTGSNPVNDVFTSVCRPVIGLSGDGNFHLLNVAYTKARNDTDSHGNNFFDIYTTCSGNAGASWSTPYQITNQSGPLCDNRYVSMAQICKRTNQDFKLYLTYLRDTIPGSSINGASPSLAKLFFADVTITACSGIGITNTNNEIPETFQLKQNYPNPFNPITQIEFSVSTSANVKLNIFDVNGRLITTLINSTMNPGNYIVDFDGKELSSGVYYYIMQYHEIGSGIQNSISRKMVLIK